MEGTPWSDHNCHCHSARGLDLRNRQYEFDELNANLSWNAREHALIREMGSYLEKGESILVVVDELEYFLLGPTDVAGTHHVLGRKRVVMELEAGGLH